MAGLVPAIHVFCAARENKDVDARDERGHDAVMLLEVRIAWVIAPMRRAAVWRARHSRRDIERLTILDAGFG
jgi:hypothetical protein